MSKKKSRGARSSRKKANQKRAELEEAAEARAAEALRVVTDRAVWRLNLMEYLLLVAAAGLSLVAGAVAALALQAPTGLSFRLLWGVGSLLFFVIPGAAVLGRERRARRGNSIRSAGSSLKENDG